MVMYQTLVFKASTDEIKRAYRKIGANYIDVNPDRRAR